MSRITADLKAFAIQYLRNPFGAAFSIGFPLLLVICFGAMFSPSATPDVHLLIQDLDGTPMSEQFIDTLNQTTISYSGTFETYMTEPTYDMNESVLQEHELSGAIVIPAGFEAQISGNQSVDIIVFLDESSSTDGVILENVDTAIVTFEASSSVSGQYVSITITEIDNGEFNFLNFFLPGIIALTIMLNCLMILASLMADYWSHGYFKILKTTPLKKWEWVLSKLIWYLVVMAVAILLLFVVGVGLFGANVTITPIAIALIVAGTLLFSSIGMIIGALAKHTDTAAGISQAIGQPMMFLSGIFWQLEEFPPIMQTISKFFPLTYLGAGLRATMLEGNDILALENLAVVVVLAVVFFILAVKLIKWKEK